MKVNKKVLFYINIVSTSTIAEIANTVFLRRSSIPNQNKHHIETTIFTC